jgi:hypothetical protein
MIRILPTTWGARAKTLALAFLLVAVVGALAISPALAVATTFTVTNTNDSGDGSLRQAIIDANDNANPTERDTIDFDIPASDPNCNASGVCTITPASALPTISEPVTIDGYTQPGASPNTLATGTDAALKIELSGRLRTINDVWHGITITGSNSVVKGLIINDGWNTGIQICCAGANGNHIEGNYIGTDASGTLDRGNRAEGVWIIDSSNNVVGGTSPDARNVLSGNGAGVFGAGVFLSGRQGDNRIQGNYIGTDANGNGGLGNGIGIGNNTSPNNLVGGTSAAARNVITSNEGDGVHTVNSRILRNSIFDNGGLGISGGGPGVDANDVGDADLPQNYPVITSATTFAGKTTIQGTLNSAPFGAFDLRFFSSPAADPSGFGEGETYVGQTNVVANDAGNAAFSFTTNTPISGGQVVTATATISVNGGTSEFSEAVQIDDDTPPPPPAPQCSDGADNDMDNKIDFSGTGGDPDCTSATDNSESPDLPDTTSPTVLSTDPMDGAPGVARNAIVSATFSEAMKASTINKDTFTLFRKQGASLTKVSAVVTYDEANKKATLRPTSLGSRVSYVATVTSGAQDLAGNPLDQNPNESGTQEKAFSFVTARK